jgi:FkbM family methyltransferase
MRPFGRILPKSVLMRIPLTTKFAVKIPSGRTFWILARDDDLAPSLFWRGLGGWWEPETVAMFLQLVRQGRRTFLDVGAYTGAYSLMASRMSGDIDIFAFEPEPRVRRRLLENLRLNDLGDVRVFDLAVSDRSGPITMFTADTTNLPSVSSVTANDEADVREPMAVRAITLDEFVDRESARPDLLKVDADGSEPAILRGGAGMLKRDRPVVICEVLEDSEAGDLERLLPEIDYRSFLMTSSGLQERTSIEPDKSLTFKNYLLAPAEQSSELQKQLDPRR